jgi:hypothetical protein
MNTDESAEELGWERSLRAPAPLPSMVREGPDESDLCSSVFICGFNSLLFAISKCSHAVVALANLAVDV